MVPVKPNDSYRQRPKPQQRAATAKLAIGGLVLGALIGVVSLSVSRGETSPVVAAAKPLAVSAGLVRARAPQVGDHWRNCDAARAAGTSPIFRTEPGYAWYLDEDNDGLACEPHLDLAEQVRKAW